MMPDMSNRDKNAVYRAEKLAIVQEEQMQPQTMSNILASIDARKKALEERKKEIADQKAQFLLATKKNAALQQQRKKEAAQAEKKKEKGL
jgi:hypothetical protein